MAVEIKKSILTQQVEEGWKRKALAEHYELPETQMAQVLKDVGLKIRKFHAPKYQLIDDSVEEEVVEERVEEVGEDINALVEGVVEEQIVPVTETTTSW